MKFAAIKLNNRIQSHTSKGSGEYSELPNTPEHDQTLVNQSYQFPTPPQAMTFQNNNGSYPTPYCKDKPDEEKRIRKEQVYEIPEDIVIYPILNSIATFSKSAY